MIRTTLNRALIKQVVLAKQANQRQGTSHTKTRGEVAGGGRKPWKQKGTGRARAGSNRSPIWIGGGIVFGPSSDRNFKQRLPKKMARRALLELMDHAKGEGRVIMEKTLVLAAPKTKLVIALIAKHKVANRPILFITEAIEPELILASNNLPKTRVTQRVDLSVLHLINEPMIFIEEASYNHVFTAKLAKRVKKVEPSEVTPTNEHEVKEVAK